MKYFSFLIIIILFSMPSFSQRKVPGYIVTNNGDTLNGMIKRTGAFNDKPGFTFFYDKDKNQKILDKDILAFGWIKDSVKEDYIKIKALGIGSGGYAFLRKIVIGKISLFTDMMGNLETIYMYTEDNKEHILTEGIAGINKKTLKTTLKNCPAVLEKITGIIDRKKLIELIKEYNTCN
jgi:hypothetical protein